MYNDPLNIDLPDTSQGRKVERKRKPRSLFQFLVWKGGLKPHPDLKAILDGKFGWMVRKSGMSLDEAREACIEEHFLLDNENADYAPTINDLLELIAAEAKGHKQYRIRDLVDVYEGREVEQLLRPKKSTYRMMRADEYHTIRKQLGLTQTKLAEELGVGIRQAQRYEAGQPGHDIPETVARLLRMYARFGIPEE